MALRRDPQDTETTALFDFVGDFSGKHVLEVGSGTGRLTWRYAHAPGRVTGIDPDPERVACARQDLPADLRDRVTFHVAGIEAFTPDERFDLILFSWSL